MDKEKKRRYRKLLMVLANKKWPQNAKQLMVMSPSRDNTRCANLLASFMSTHTPNKHSHMLIMAPQQVRVPVE